MTNIYFFDSDCLSSFLAIDKQEILIRLYKNNIYIPPFVYEELTHAPKCISKKLISLVNKGIIKKMNIMYGTKEYKEYVYLTASNLNNKKIGKGEASAIALAKTKGGILASNNLKDISYYVKEYKLKHITTSDILIEALNGGAVNFKQCEEIWHEMKDNNKMPKDTFSEYYKNKNINKK